MKFRLFSQKRRPAAFWVDVALLAAGCLLYVFITSLFLANESSYFDEGFTSYLAHFSPLQIAHYTALDVHPPLYYIALHFWQQLVGVDVFGLRFLSILWGIIAIIFAFLIVHRVFGRGAAWSTLLFVILSPLFIRYSEAMRMYTMALAIISAATYLLILLNDPETKHRKGLWAIYAVLVSAGMWTNYFTVFIWLAHFIWVIAESRFSTQERTKKFAIHWLLAIGGSIILYLPWLPWLVIRFTDVQTTGFWIKPISVDTVVSTLTTATVYHNAAMTTGWLALVTCVYLVTAGYCITKAYSMITEQQRSYFRLLLLGGFVPIIGLILLSLPPLQSSYVYRYVLAGIFMTTIITGVSFAAVRFSRHHLPKKIMLYSLAVATLLCGTIAVKQAGNRSLDTGVKNMVAQAIEHIHSTGTPGTPVISRSPYTYYTASLYETADYPVYYTFSQSLRTVGSTHMLYDHPEKRGIKDLAVFAEQQAKVWIIAEDKQSAMEPPLPTWKRSQAVTLYDPVTKSPAAYISEYTKP